MQLALRQQLAAVATLVRHSLQVLAFGQQAARFWAQLPMAAESPAQVLLLWFSAEQLAEEPAHPWPIRAGPPQAQAVPPHFQRPDLQLPPRLPATATPLPGPVQTIRPRPPAVQVPVAQGCNRQRATRPKRRWVQAICP